MKRPTHLAQMAAHEALMRRHIESKEQREGRGLRQGNEVYGPVLDNSGAVIDPGAGIRIFLYVTERSFDGYIWQAIEAKARGFKAVLRRSVTVPSARGRRRRRPFGRRGQSTGSRRS